jgi:hypothetical protein
VGVGLDEGHRGRPSFEAGAPCPGDGLASAASRRKRGGEWGDFGAGMRKKFFFEKKNQKTFTNLASVHADQLSPGFNVFCFFFSKKKCFLS